MKRSGRVDGQNFERDPVEVDRTRGTSKMEHAMQSVPGDQRQVAVIERQTDVAFDEMEVRIFEGASEVFNPTGQKIIKTRDRIALRKQCFREVRADKAGGAGEQDVSHFLQLA